MLCNKPFRLGSCLRKPTLTSAKSWRSRSESACLRAGFAESAFFVDPCAARISVLSEKSSAIVFVDRDCMPVMLVGQGYKKTGSVSAACYKLST